MKIATPISHLFEDPSVGKEIYAYSDCLECRERTNKLEYPKRNLYHVDIDIGHEWKDERKKYICDLFIDKKELKLISFQMTCCYEEPTLENGIYQPGGRGYSREEMIGYSKQNIVWLRGFLNKNIILAVENNNYYPTPAYRDVTDGDFISRIVEENDIQLLYDIAHAQVSAKNLKLNYESYRNSLPMKHVIQLHICRPELETEVAYDAHELPDELMFQEVVSLANQFDIKYLTIEYYKDKENLIMSLIQLKKLINEKQFIVRN
jgi:uncharacterized protein (UPF0276 family)